MALLVLLTRVKTYIVSEKADVPEKRIVHKIEGCEWDGRSTAGTEKEHKRKKSHL